MENKIKKVKKEKTFFICITKFLGSRTNGKTFVKLVYQTTVELLCILGRTRGTP